MTNDFTRQIDQEFFGNILSTVDENGTLGAVLYRHFPSPSQPMEVARQLSQQWWHSEAYTTTVKHWRGSWMQWCGSYWIERDPQEIRAALYREMERAEFSTTDPKGNEVTRSWSPTKRKIADLMDAISAVAHLGPAVDAPAWINRDGLRRDSGNYNAHGGEGPIVACTNGLLRMSDRHLMDLTPAFFNLVSVPFDYDKDATAPTWQAFLTQVWPDEPAAVDMLQEWFGYVLSGRTDLQKILLIVGPTRSGKGTIARILASLVGAGNMAGPTLASLATNFGLSPLLGKSLGVISDARLAGRDGHQVVERLLTISGEDTIDVDRKFRDPWTGKLPTRLLILSNELPNFGDASGVIANRFVVLTMDRSWLGKEDPTLTDKLAAEMPGILNWALDGLARLELNGRFTEPAGSQDAVITMQDTASPTSAFVREMCDKGPTREVAVDDLWAVWKDWAEDQGIRAGSKAMLGRNLQSVVPQVKRTRPRDDSGRQVPTYTGIALRSSTRNSGSPVSTRLNESETGLRRVETGLSPLWPQHSEGRPVCVGCGFPFDPIEVGQTTHPTCDTKEAS